MRILIVVLTLVALTAGTSAQAPATPSPASAEPFFDLVSVKASLVQAPGRIRWSPGRLLVTNQPFRGLLLWAYPNVNINRFVDTPEWLDSARWDINAAADPSRLTDDKRALALRSLLEDRFRLIVRKEQRQADVYALVVARDDGRLGPALRPSTLACDAPERARSTPGPRSLPGANERPPCGAGSSGGALVIGDLPIEWLATVLSIATRTEVVDRTNLSGKFDLTLSYAPDGGSAAAAPAIGPSIFTALQEQLGLKLQQERIPVDFYVIERVERPASD